jgi:addiction module RelB/DinJ family antitoxin
MAQVSVNIRMDETLKQQADALFHDFGMNMTTAVNVFVRQTVRERRIPFIIGYSTPEAVGDVVGYRSADDMIIREGSEISEDDKN